MQRPRLDQRQRILGWLGAVCVVCGMIRMFIRVANSSTRPSLTELFADVGWTLELTIAAIIGIISVVDLCSLLRGR